MRTPSAGCELRIRATPKSHRDSVEVVSGTVRVHVRAAPEDDNANEAIGELLSAKLRIPRRRLKLVRGAKSRAKTFWVEGMTADEVITRLSE